jgi:clan AA aspartic protease (TIGR02281 family)
MKDLYPNRITGSLADLEGIPKMQSDEEHAATFRRSPVRRPKLSGMKRNAAALLGSLAVFVFLYGTAAADTVYLKNGRKLEGIVKSETDKAIELEVGFGTVKLMRADIESIERTDESGTDRLKEKWAKQAEARLQAEKARQYAPKEIAAFDENGHLFLAVRINEKVDAKLLLDTGASTILLSRQKAEASRLDLESPKRIQAKIADGRTVEAIPVMLETVRVGDVSAENVQAAVLAESLPDGHFDGLLGMSFLNRFNFQVDYANKKLILEKRR